MSAQADPAAVADALLAVVAQIDAGTLTAPAPVRYRLEGAALALRAVSEGRIPTAAALLASLGIQDTDV